MRAYIFGVAFVAFGLTLVPRAGAATTAFVDFETNPVLAQQTSLFLSAGNEQNIVVPGMATFSGGVVLGDETNLPALAYGTSPNVYGTATASYVSSSFILPDQLTITVNPSYTVNEISFPLFNGFTGVVTYTVDAYNGSTPIGQQILSDVASNLASGHGVIDLKAPDMTSVVITPSNTSSWDYSIDSVAFNEPVSSAITPSGTPITSTPVTGVPLPSAAWSALAMFAAMGAVSFVRSRRKNAAV